ncbi:MAG TPA: hypothetical protein VFW02_10605 [Candidatus Limnocylindrales bacterium]|nr:hypothetical protein [Candidatus Limnocylindrales bacterium]
MNERIERFGAGLAGRVTRIAGEPGTRFLAEPHVRRARARWGRPLAVALTIVTTAIGVGFFVVAGSQVGWAREWFDDLKIYTAATDRLINGVGWYLQRQVDGPYLLEHGDVLYPPVTAWFFLPWLVLPGWTFSAVPLAIIAWFVRAARPAAWTWPVMAFCFVFPVTLVYVAYANPTLWIAAFVALGLRFGWPGVLVLLKPSLAPFALIGIRSRGWWIGLVALGLASLPVLALTLDYPRIVLDSRGSDLLYSGTSVPIVLLPIVAWLGRRVQLAPKRGNPQTRPETQ